MVFDRNRDDLKKFGLEIFQKLDGKNKPVFLCVGSDKFVCDSLAPIVAELMRKQYDIDAYVYGGLDYNINAHNLMQVVNYIETQHPFSTLFLIDATLDCEVGKIKLNEGSFAGLGRCLPIRKIGVYSILGVVEKKSAQFNLNSTRMKIVLELAEFIAKGCAMAVFTRAKFCREIVNM